MRLSSLDTTSRVSRYSAGEQSSTTMSSRSDQVWFRIEATDVVKESRFGLHVVITTLISSRPELWLGGSVNPSNGDADSARIAGAAIPWALNRRSKPARHATASAKGLAVKWFARSVAR